MSRAELAYMASALAMMSQGLEPPTYHREKPKPRKAEQKKCKSCKFFEKGKDAYSHNCTNPKGHPKRFVEPLDIACNEYKKRKR